MSNQINNSLNNCSNLSKSHSTTSIAKHITLENKEKYDNSVNSLNNTQSSINKNLRLRSPKSITAMKILGMTKEELVPISFDDYKRIYPDIISLPIELQYSRYEFYETHRREKVKQFLEKKENLLNENDKCSKSSQLSNDIYAYIMDYVPKGRKRVVTNEIRRYERLQNNNDAELMLTIQNAIKNEMTLNGINRKNQLDYQRNMEGLEKRRQKLEWDNKQRQLKNEAREKQRELDILKKKQQEQENAMREQERNDKEYLKQQRQNAEMIYKSKEDALKREAHNNRVIEMEHNHMDQVQSDIDAKDEAIKKHLFKKKLARSMTHRSMSNMKQDFQFSQDIKPYTTKNGIEIISKEHIHCQYYTQRYHDDLVKSAKVKCVLQNHQKLFEQKVMEIKEREKGIRDRAELNELSKIEEQKKYQRELLQKRIIVQQIIQKNEIKNKERKENIIQKFDNKDDYIQKVNQMKHKDLLFKKEDENRKQYLKEDSIRMLSNRSSYKQETLNMEILEKRRKISDYTEKKNKIAAELKKMQLKIEEKKQKETEKLKRILNKRSFGRKEIDNLKELYPKKENFEVLMKKWKESNSNNKYMNGELRIRTNSQCAIKPVYPSEMEMKLKQRREELSQELDELLKEERIKEEYREMTLTNEKNKKKKIALEKVYSLERAEASEKITMLKDSIERQMHFYAKELRTRQQYNISSKEFDEQREIEHNNMIEFEGENEAESEEEQNIQEEEEELQQEEEEELENRDQELSQNNEEDKQEQIMQEDKEEPQGIILSKEENNIMGKEEEVIEDQVVFNKDIVVLKDDNPNKDPLQINPKEEVVNVNDNNEENLQFDENKEEIKSNINSTPEESLKNDLKDDRSISKGSSHQSNNDNESQIS